LSGHGGDQKIPYFGVRNPNSLRVTTDESQALQYVANVSPCHVGVDDRRLVADAVKGFGAVMDGVVRRHGAIPGVSIVVVPAQVADQASGKGRLSTGRIS
jgi:hypothetical protein